MAWGERGSRAWVSRTWASQMWEMAPSTLRILNPESFPEIRNLTQPSRTSLCVDMCTNICIKTDKIVLPSLPNRPFMVLEACEHPVVAQVRTHPGQEPVCALETCWLPPRNGDTRGLSQPLLLCYRLTMFTRTLREMRDFRLWWGYMAVGWDFGNDSFKQSGQSSSTWSH